MIDEIDLDDPFLDPFDPEVFEAIDREMSKLKLRPGVRTWGEVRNSVGPLQTNLFDWA